MLRVRARGRNGKGVGRMGEKEASPMTGRLYALRRQISGMPNYSLAKPSRSPRPRNGQVATAAAPVPSLTADAYQVLLTRVASCEIRLPLRGISAPCVAPCYPALAYVPLTYYQRVAKFLCINLHGLQAV